jgi:hypothetical protein
MSGADVIDAMRLLNIRDIRPCVIVFSYGAQHRHTLIALQEAFAWLKNTGLFLPYGVWALASPYLMWGVTVAAPLIFECGHGHLDRSPKEPIASRF